jgi:hypothetical protein
MVIYLLPGFKGQAFKGQDFEGQDFKGQDFKGQGRGRTDVLR